MRNRYGGTCYRCGDWCPAGSGHFERFQGKWRVQHASCAISKRGKPDPARAEHKLFVLKEAAKQTGRRAQRARRRLRDMER